MLSFVVPVYKPDVELFRKCLDSLITQSLKDMEIIVVYDGPVDKEVTRITSKISKKFPIHEVYLSENHGACVARNEGAVRAKGEYICYWDCDCIIEPEAAEMWVRELNENKDIDFVYSGYQFLGEKGGIASSPFDEYLLTCRNYISTCFPVRRSKAGVWDKKLESLQDWDFWLQVVKNGGKGLFVPGYAFKTAYPTPESISGKGCTQESWLGRLKAVREKHGIENRKVCVTSIEYPHEGLRLAKLIEADYVDFPAAKPHEYESIIQVGFNLGPNTVEQHTSAWGTDKKIKRYIFWTANDIMVAYNGLSFRAIRGDNYTPGYVKPLAKAATHFVEDLEAQKQLKELGLDSKILPIPMEAEEIKPLPDKPRFLVDIGGEFSRVFSVLKECLPDIELVPLNNQESIDKFTGLLHFYMDRTQDEGIKRAVVSGRHVISNVKGLLMNYQEDRDSPDVFIPRMVDRIREIADRKPDKKLTAHFVKQLDKKHLLGVL